MQADAQEFLIYIIQKTTISFAETFNIKILETIEKSCKKHTIKNASDENMLNLKINNPAKQKLIDINDLLKEYFQKEQIDCNCETCKTSTAQKYSLLRTTAQNLIIVLNIFKFKNNVSKKITTFIELINEINLSGYYEDLNGINSQHFKLYGVCYHHGNDINSGHYTSKAI